MLMEAPGRHAMEPSELMLEADRARRLAWTAGDWLTYERLAAYAEELEAEAIPVETPGWDGSP